MVERLRSAVATLALVRLVVNTKYQFVYPFLPAIARGLGIDLTQAGVLVSARSASSLTTSVVMSLAGDMHRSRRLLLSGALVFSIAALVTAFTGVFIGAVVGFILAGLAKPMVDTGSQVYVSERVPYQARARYLGILEISWAGGLLVGAPAAGWLIDNFTWRAPFWVLGSFALIGLGLIGWFLEPDDEAAAALTPRGEDTPGRQVLLILAVVALYGFAHETVLVTLGGWLEGSFGMTLLALGGVGTMIGFSELAGEGAMVAFTDRIGKRNSLAMGLGLAGVSLTALSLTTDTLIPAMAALLVAVFALEFGYISIIPLMTEQRPRSRTRALSMAVVATGLGRITGDLVGPRVFVAAGMGFVTIAAAAVTFLAVAVVLTGIKEVDPARSPL